MIEAWIAQQLIKGLLRSLLLTEVLELLAAAWLHGATIAWRWLWVGGLEFAVWLSEALIYRKCLIGKQNPYLFSLILNAASYLGGVCLQYFL